MANSYTDKYKKRQPAAGDLNWDEEINQDQSIDDIIGAARDKNNRAIWGLAASDGGGLSVDYAAGRAEVGGSIFEIAAGSKTAVDDATDRSVNYLYVDSSGVVQIVQSPPTGVYSPVALVDVSSGAIDRIGDFRQQPSNLLADETLAEINKIIDTSANIADVFLYDTSTDFDGGAWREKTEHLSWFNEDLDTATRGSTRKFPAIVFIIVETNSVTVYDATDVRLPMWIVFNNTGFKITNADKNSCHALNSIVFVSSATAGIYLLNFLSDIITRYTASEKNVAIGLLDDRNTVETVWSSSDTSKSIVSGNTNDITVTALPQAPIDQATGLPVPTILVGTDTGSSMITDSGVVYDVTHTTSIDSVLFVGNNRIWLKQAGGFLDFGPLFTTDTTQATWRDGSYSESSIPAKQSTTGNDISLGGATGSSLGVALIKEDPITPNNGMINYISTDYQSGWMQGDIKGAWLADTTVESLTTTDPDRSVNVNDLTVTGTIAKAVVETGADLVEYSGFGTSNYMSQAYNTDFDFGTGDFYFMGWMSVVATDIETFFNRGSAADGFLLRFRTDASGLPQFLIGATTVAGSTAINTGDKKLVVCKRVSGVGYLYINGLLVNSGAATDNVTGTDSLLFFGVDHNIANALTSTSTMALWRIGAGDITDEQISHIYETEKHLFQENAACTLDGSSDAVSALTYDKEIDFLYVGTGDGVSVFKDLNRIDYIDTTGVPTSDTVVAVSADNGAYVIGNDTEAIGYIPEANLREEITRQEEGGEILEIFWFDGDTVETDFALPAGWRPKFVYEAGLIVKEGSGEDYTITFDGFIYTVIFTSAPAAVNIGIMGMTT